MNNYLLIHGSFGSPFVNWFPYLRIEIEKRDLVVYTPDFPTGVGYQNYDNWSKVLESYVIICFYSKNDPYVKYEAEKEFADTIATKQIVIKDGGHLNSESGYTEFKELLEYL